MKKTVTLLVALAFAAAVPMTALDGVRAAASPAANKIVTTATGYDSADDVVYKKSGKYIANWGARGEDCVFLSEYAQDFYSGNYTYSVVSKQSGGTSQSSGHTSVMYASLQKLMKNNHTFYTYYNGSKNVRDFYKYTDCVKSDTTQVALLYRGGLVTSAWNSGNIWNQEHVWPKSKLKGAEEDKRIGDIMHLRPSNPNENSSRGDKAFGTTTSSSYYYPGVSVRGDCARMVLYMYVRWGASSTMWGSGGVMQSLDVLLDWMEEDPVDTWEMGRNDSVQSITGTRNVFVDYPEYAWLMFGQQLPKNMVTPSGIAKGGEQQPEQGGNQGGEQQPEQGGNQGGEQQPEQGGNQGGEQQPEQGGNQGGEQQPEQGGNQGGEQQPEQGGNQGGEQDKPNQETCSHVYGKWTVTKKPTATEYGERTRVCGTCGAEEKNVLEKLSVETEDSAGEGITSSINISCASSMGGLSAGCVLALACAFVLGKKRKN